MSNFQNRQNREELRILLARFQNLKNGFPDSYIEEEGFEYIIEHFEEREKHVQALEACAYGISQYPYSGNLLLLNASMLVVLRRYEAALDILQKLSVLNFLEVTKYVLEAECYLALNQNDDAETTMTEAISLFEGEEKVDLLFELADVFDDYEIFDKVFECMKLILEIEGNNEEALYKICFWTEYTGRNEESIRLHQNIIEQFPFNELAWFNLGAAYQGIKLHEKAIEAYLYATAIDERFDYAYRNLGDAYLRLRRFPEAIESLQKVLDIASPETVLYEAIGHCWDKMNKFSEARKSYAKAIELNPEDHQLHYKVGCTHMNEGHWNLALKSLLIANKVHKIQPEYNHAIGQCYMEMQNYDEAVTYIGTVVRIRPKNILAWTDLLRCFHLAEQWEEGFEYAQFAWEQTEGKPIFLFYKSLFLFEQGKFKEALVFLENGMHISPKLVKKLVELNPLILQHPAVVDVIARYKQRKFL